MLRRRYLSFLLLVFTFAWATPVRAQISVASGSGLALAPTPVGTGGVKLGDALVLHLGIGTEFGWDSNVFFQAESEGPINSFYMRLTPNFRLTTAPRGATPIAQFDFHGGLNYVEYLTSNKQLQNDRQFNVDAGVLGSFFASQPYHFVLFDNYVRSTMPPYLPTDQNFERDTNEIGTRITLSPGGGRLTFDIGYLFGIDYFEDDPLTQYDLQYHRFDVRASWRFLPKTAVYLAADETIYTYPHPGTSDHPDSFPLHVDAGIQGLITKKLVANAWVGYGNGFYQWPASVMGTHPNPNTAIGGLSLAWTPTILSTGTIGYEHDFENSLLGAYYDEDSAYVSWTQLVWRFTGYVRFQYTNARFQGVQPVQATTNGTDNYITFNARVDYPIKNWLIGSVGYDLYFNSSNRTLMLTGPSLPGVIPADFTKNVVYLRVAIQY